MYICEEEILAGLMLAIGRLTTKPPNLNHCQIIFRLYGILLLACHDIITVCRMCDVISFITMYTAHVHGHLLNLLILVALSDMYS